MDFVKMQGCGNDYVYVDCTAAPLPNPGAVARQVSDRHFGIGSDGLILICPSEQADFRMAMYNADGSEGAMCGNGIRCVGKFVYDRKLTDKTNLTIETRSGLKYLALTVEDGKVSKVRVDMGRWSTAASALPVVGLGDEVIGVPVTVGGERWEMTCVSMGNPHAVVWCDDLEHLDIAAIGPQFEQHPMFPDRVNTEFVHIIDRQHLALRVWERGAGETLACGTGACAAAVAAFLNGYCDSAVSVQLLGGTLEIQLSEGRALMTGPAVTVFSGEIALQGRRGFHEKAD